jgi:hypothetical protein
MSSDSDNSGNDAASAGPDRAAKFERTKRHYVTEETDRQIVYAHGHMGKLDRALEQIENPIVRDKARALARGKISEHLRKGGEFNPPTMTARAIARRVDREELDRRQQSETAKNRRDLGQER